MEATTVGMNRTGAALSPLGTKAMSAAADEFGPSGPIDTTAMDAERVRYILDAEAVGSVPPPASLKGVVKTGLARMKGGAPGIFLDKLGERIAFERGGTRLYDALLTKYQALQQSGGDELPTAEQVLATSAGQPPTLASVQGESPLATLTRIRNEEHQHFRMLGAAMEKMGGDPTAMTPCADVQGTAALGILQVVSDPRTTLAQSLNAVLSAELTDNAGWELLVQLAEQVGESELAGQFLGALAQEQEHLAIVKGWLTQLVTEHAGSPAV